MDVLPSIAGSADPGIGLSSNGTRSANAAAEGNGDIRGRVERVGFLHMVERLAMEHGEAFLDAGDAFRTAVPVPSAPPASPRGLSEAGAPKTGSAVADVLASSGPAAHVETISSIFPFLQVAPGSQPPADPSVAPSVLKPNSSLPLAVPSPVGDVQIAPSASREGGQVVGASPSPVPSGVGIVPGRASTPADRLPVALGEVTVEVAGLGHVERAGAPSYSPKGVTPAASGPGAKMLMTAPAVDMVFASREVTAGLDAGLVAQLDALEQEGVRRVVAPQSGERSLAGHIPAQAAAAATQIAARLNALSADIGGPIEIALDPPELGRVRIVMHAADGMIALTVQAELPQTVDLLRRQADSLLEELRVLGYGEANLDFSSSRDWGGDATDESAAPLTPDGEDNVLGHATTPVAVVVQQVDATGQLDLRT